jgi:hypothetical protein
MRHHYEMYLPARQVGARKNSGPATLISHGSGQESWLSLRLDSLEFTLDTGSPSPSREVLSLADVRLRFPFVLDRLAELVVAEIRSSSAGP